MTISQFYIVVILNNRLVTEWRILYYIIFPDVFHTYLTVSRQCATLIQILKMRYNKSLCDELKIKFNVNQIR